MTLSLEMEAWQGYITGTLHSQRWAAYRRVERLKAELVRVQEELFSEQNTLDAMDHQLERLNAAKAGRW